MEADPRPGEDRSGAPAAADEGGETRHRAGSAELLACSEPAGEERSRARLARIGAHSASPERYRVRAELARGGMGVIYKVWDEDLHRLLAMKLVAPEAQGDELVLRRFLDEAEVTAQLDHPGIVPVHEAGLDAQGRVFFVMPLVDGRSGDEIFACAHDGRDGWNRTRALGVVLKACEAVAYAHAKGVVHRDLKPSNLMVGRFGQVYVMDWGVAKMSRRFLEGPLPAREVEHDQSSISLVRERVLAGKDTRATRSGTVIGTPAYMSPEQAWGRMEEVGPLSDVYSLGACLYHLLAGHMPYDEPDDDGVRRRRPDRVLSGAPRALHAIDPRLPHDLVAVCAKSMERDPARRYASALELADDLRAYLEGHVVRAYRTGVAAELRKWVARNRLAAASLIALVLLALASAVVGVVLQRERIASVRAEKYAANLWAAEGSLRLGETSEAARRLADCDPEERGWEWEHLHLRADPSYATLADHTGSVQALAVSPRGERVASASVDGSVRLWGPRGEPLGLLEPGGGELNAVVFDPSGRRLATGGEDGGVRVIDVDPPGGVRVLCRFPGRVNALAFSPDGARLSIGSSDGTARIVAAQTGAVVLTFEGREPPVYAVAFDRNGATLAVAARELELFDARDGALVRRLERHPEFVSSVAFDPVGGRVVSGSLDGRVRIFRADGTRQCELAGHKKPVRAVAFDPTGTRVASASEDKTIRVWDASGGRELALLAGHEGQVNAVAFHPDGRWLYSGSRDRSLRVWSAVSAALPVWDGFGRWVEAVAFLPDGWRIVSSARPSGAGSPPLAVWDSRNGELLLECRVGERVRALALGPEGSWVAAALGDGSVRIVDLARGDTLLELRPESEAQHAACVAWDPRGRWIATGTKSGVVRLWDAVSGRLLVDLEGHSDLVRGLAFDPRGERLASASRDGSVRLWDPARGVELAHLVGHGGWVNAVAFAPDGARLASASRDGSVRVWDARSGRALFELRGHDDAVLCVAYSPDGTRLVSGSEDDNLRVWDARSGAPLIALRGQHTDWVQSLAFSPDGTSLASASRDGSVRIWRSARPAR